MTGASPSQSPSAFRETPSGLYVPETVERPLEVWTRDEWKTIDRAAKLLTARGLRLKFFCDEAPDCPVETFRNAGGEAVLRCAHKDRLFTRAY